MTGNPKKEAEMQYVSQAKLRVHTGKKDFQILHT